MVCSGRHAHGDQYKATDIVIPASGNVKIVYSPAAGGAAQVHTPFCQMNMKGSGQCL
jgi:isocitrate dehydrogenase